MLHSTWHEAHNQALVQPRDIWVMGQRGKHKISPKKVMVDLECSPLSNSQDMSPHLQTHLECLQHCLEKFQSFCRQLPPLLHRDNFPGYLGDPPVGSQQNDFSRVRNREWQMVQGLPICSHYQIFPKTNRMQMMRVTIHRTWAGPKTKPQSAWSKRDPPWSHSPKDGAGQLQWLQQVEEIWVTAFLKKIHQSIMWGQNNLKQLRDGPLH